MLLILKSKNKQVLNNICEEMKTNDNLSHYGFVTPKEVYEVPNPTVSNDPRTIIKTFELELDISSNMKGLDDYESSIVKINSFIKIDLDEHRKTANIIKEIEDKHNELYEKIDKMLSTSLNLIREQDKFIDIMVK